MSDVFISYRRADDPGAVGRLHERLVARLRRPAVFYDHLSIDPGDEFPERLRERVTSAGTVLVVIGPRWLAELEARAADPSRVDHVREEVRLALGSGGDVVPVLVGGAPMPTEAALAAFPDVLPLLGRNAVEIPPGPLFDAGCDRLIAHLERSADLRDVVLAGKYKLQRSLGEGGMGEVFLAEQVAPVRRLVAVKVVKPGMDTREVLARFDGERQALAVMDHPNVCKVLDAGTTPSGRPFFVMEYVKGESIARFCDGRRLPVRERLELFGAVCAAVQHAHQKGIVHRDLKPDNVLVETLDGRPVPKVIDFGLAKALSRRLTDASFAATEVGRWVGTLEYSSPEQAEGRHEVDTLSDVYSLGVLLYELLAGRPPFSRGELPQQSETAMRRMILEVDPPLPSARLRSAADLPALAAARRSDPSALVREVRGELDWIVRKALEKEPRNRFPTVDAFADSVRRHLAGEAVPGVRLGVVGRLRKYVRRNRREVRLVTRLATVLAGVALVGTLGWLLVCDAGYGGGRGRGVRDWLDDRGLSVLREPLTDADVDRRVRKRQERITGLVLPLRDDRGYFLYQPPKYTHWDEWTQAQVASGLYPVEGVSPADKALTTRSLVRMVRDAERFVPGRGWRYFNGQCPLEPVAWCMTALCRAVGHHAADPAARGDALSALDALTKVLDRASYAPHGKPGGWGLFVDETPEGEPNLYITALVLQGLLEMRSAGIGWDGDEALRDRHLHEAAALLLRRHGDGGWSFITAIGGGTTESGNAFLYALLLRAHLEAGVEIPSSWRTVVPALIDRLAAHPTDHPIVTVFFHARYLDERGQPVYHGNRPVKLPWFPNALALASVWQRYCAHHSLDIRRTRRLLVRLLDAVDGHVDQYHESARFFEGEVLYALSLAAPRPQ